MTKEEIINAELDNPTINDIDGEFPRDLDGEWPSTKIYKAMDEYAKEMSTSFFKWYAIKMHTFIEYIKDVRPLVISDEIEKKIQEFEGKTIDKLYQQYFQSLNQ